MIVSPGSRLGPYEISAHLGAGGMGEVWRARDARLSRDVAIKLLPVEIANDPERLARFRREAQVLASLNHPHVGAIHGLEESNGTPFLVLELVEGEDLASRVARGPVPLDEALAIAVQIAEALEAAHEKGIVHRDLKPANVKVTPEGAVKLLDFGLAKTAAASGGASGELSLSPTITAHGTQAGMILGTAAYMSPEQARGRPVDKRADVWAFGVVLYEMLAGRRLFQGETVSDVLASVLKNEPDLGALGDVPPRVRRVLARCLRKDPKERLHDIGDARLELLEKDESAPAAMAPPRAPRSGALLALVSIAAVLGIGGAVWSLASTRRAAPVRAPLKLHVLPPPGTLSSGPIDISPDGTKLAFTATGADGRTLVYVRSLDALEAKPLAGTDGADAPFFSPDGASLGFFARKKLKRIAIAGGPPRELADVTDHRGGSWGASGVIVYVAEGGGPVLKIPAEGGTPVAVTKLDAARQETSHRWPQFLADGTRVLFMSRKPKPPARLVIEAATLDGGTRVPLTEGITTGRVVGGRLIFGRGSSLLSQPIDAKTLALSGEPQALADDLWTSPVEMDGLTAFAVAANGTVAYRGGGVARYQLTWRDREGRKLGMVGGAGFAQNASLAPDLSRVVVDVTDVERNTSSVRSIDVASGRETRLTFSSANDLKPVVSPDGRSVVYTSDARGPFDLFQVDAAGGEPTPLLTSEIWKYPGSFSKDGRFLAFKQYDPKTKSDLWILPLGGDRKPFAFLRTAADEGSPEFAPNGRFLAYDSDAAGTREVFIQPFPAGGAKWQVSTAGGALPAWSADGRELFYVTPDGWIASVPIAPSASGLSVGTPQRLFHASMRDTSSGRQYDVAPDGKRFLVVEPVGVESSSPIVVVVPGS
jgi:serine/threonine protein kinase/Tol biopolymer transport system component